MQMTQMQQFNKKLIIIVIVTAIILIAVTIILVKKLGKDEYGNPNITLSQKLNRRIQIV
jgi:hypothetical protein